MKMVKKKPVPKKATLPTSPSSTISLRSGKIIENQQLKKSKKNDPKINGSNTIFNTDTTT
jgi:hypothetical protein